MCFMSVLCCNFGCRDLDDAGGQSLARPFSVHGIYGKGICIFELLGKSNSYAGF